MLVLFITTYISILKIKNKIYEKAYKSKSKSYFKWKSVPRASSCDGYVCIHTQEWNTII